MCLRILRKKYMNLNLNSQIWRTLLLLLLAPVTRRGGARLRRRRPLVPVLRMVLGRDGQFVKVLESQQNV